MLMLMLVEVYPVIVVVNSDGKDLFSFVVANNKVVKGLIEVFGGGGRDGSGSGSVGVCVGVGEMVESGNLDEGAMEERRELVGSEVEGGFARGTDIE